MTGTTLPSSLLPTLPGPAYTDPAVFAAEQRHIFAALWCCVARTADFAAPGRFRVFEVGGESVIVTRDREQRLHAFLNVCRHRGARLCLAAEGEVKRTFRCAYHAWTYGLDGRLTAAPNLVEMPDIDRTEYGLRPVHLREWLGYVWLCVADVPPSFEESVIGAATERLGSATAIEHYGIDRLAVGRTIRYEVKANWKLVIENFMECYHCATIHPELTEVLPEFRKGLAAQYFVGHGAEFGPRVDGFTVDGRPGLGKLPGVAAEQDRRYYAITIKPQALINLVPDHIVFLRVNPVSAGLTVIECDWLFAPEALAAGSDIEASVELFHRVNLQDFEACERTQPGMASRLYANGGVLVPSEHHIALFHQWVTERLANA